jgi:hypothetical protein
VPDRGTNNLAAEVRKITKRLEPEAARLKKKDNFVSVIIYTQGVPTNERGEGGPAVLKEYVDALKSLSALPVKIIFRLCTDNEKVMQFYNAMDVKFDCDVLDDYWGEVRKVVDC